MILRDKFLLSILFSVKFPITSLSLKKKIASKKGERYDEVMRYIRVKLSFLVQRAALLCLRGTRVRNINSVVDEGVDFGLKLNELNC